MRTMAKEKQSSEGRQYQIIYATKNTPPQTIGLVNGVVDKTSGHKRLMDASWP